MNRRKFFFTSAGTALSFTPALHASESLLTWTGSQASLLATHNALFEFWFPLSKLKMNPGLRAEVTPIATQVDATMFAEFQESALLPLLEGMTEPKLLPTAAHRFTATNGAAVVDRRGQVLLVQARLEKIDKHEELRKATVYRNRRII
jgi:hypothetical protein